MKETTKRHGPAKEMSARFFTEKNEPIMNSIKTPSCTATVNIDAKLPRMSAGEISPKYIAVLDIVKPKESPDINRDIYSSCKVEKRR